MKQRNPAMDIVRCFALLCVVSVHFFLNCGFYKETVSGFPMFVMVTLRNFFIICVPLFMLLSGYLLNKKQLNRAYYGKIAKTVGIYLLASMACALYTFLFRREEFSLLGSIRGVFTFLTAEYSWYIEMYLGLFLLIPFLNLIYHNLPSQKHKKVLIATLLLITALPSLLNIWRFLDPKWWLKPSSDSNYDLIAPTWWIQIYPLTYYFIGAYLKEYPVKLKASVNLLLILGVTVIVGAFNFYRSYGTTFITGVWNQYRSVAVTALSVPVFIFFCNRDYSSMGSGLRKVFARMSAWSLGAYLVSSIFDNAFYELLAKWEPVVQRRILYFPLMVTAVFLCSLALSAVLNYLYDLGESFYLSRRKHAAKKEA